MGNTKQASPAAEAKRDDLECVHAQINFARRTSEENAPEVTLSKLLPKMLIGHVHEAPPAVSYDITIRNARPIVNELSLDREGFTLTQHKIACANERDQEIMHARYLEEMVPYIKHYFNASWVVPRCPHGVVSRSAGRSSVPGVKEPVAWAHIDCVPSVGPIVAKIASQLQGIPTRSYSRLMTIQTWHALSPPPQDFPLAICDASSVRDTDIDLVDYTLGTTLKLGLVHFNPAQRWYYFPDMSADEFILFKSYDSEVYPNTAHSAFDNRRAYPNANPRESLEARFFVYYA